MRAAAVGEISWIGACLSLPGYLFARVGVEVPSTASYLFFGCGVVLRSSSTALEQNGVVLTTVWGEELGN